MTPLGIIPNLKMVQVVGMFESGMYEYDANMAFVSLASAQKMFGLRGKVSGIEIKVHDIDAAAVTAGIFNLFHRLDLNDDPFVIHHAVSVNWFPGNPRSSFP